MGEILRMENIVKKFPGVLALDDVSLKLEAGDVLALMGENGAGKSTLIKILAGAYQQDEGKVWFDGVDVGKFTPRKAIASGIAVIYQELNYMPYLTVAENLFMGNLPAPKGIVDYKVLRENSMKIQKEVGLGHLDPFALVKNLSTAEKQLLEIARAVARNAKVLVLDEPTSALNDAETQILFAQIKSLQKQGKGIIYISHKMDEVFGICNKVEIMRDGTVIRVCGMQEISRDEIISCMVGRKINDMYPITSRPLGENILEVNQLRGPALRGVSIHVRTGEIVGLYGLIGSGCEEVLKSLFCAIPSKADSIKINGKTVAMHTPKDAIRHKISYTPGERKTEGLMLNQSVGSNITAVTLSHYRLWNWILNLSKEKKVVENWIKTLAIKTPSANTPVMSLSGGNQQKVILARWLDNSPEIFLMNEPTKGIDVGAKVEIYKQIENICQEGHAIVLVTSDLPELLSICDRVYVLREGLIAGEYDKDKMTAENILKSAVGA